jgi:hypothetical protein
MRQVVQQNKVMQNHENEHIRCTRQGEARHRKYMRLELVGGEAYDRSRRQTCRYSTICCANPELTNDLCIEQKGRISSNILRVR